jgi:hypothetical protein
MAFEDLLVALRDNQLGELWRQEPLQLADPPKFLDRSVPVCRSQPTICPTTSPR